MRDEREPRAARATGPGEPRPDEGHTGDTAELPLTGELLDDDGQPSESAPATQPQPQAIEEPDRRPASLVIQTSFLGDMVLTTPLIAELARDEVLELVGDLAAPLVRLVLVRDHGERVDRVAVDQHVELHEVRLAVAEHVVVERGVAAAHRLHLVEEVEDDLRERELPVDLDALLVEIRHVLVEIGRAHV